MFLVLVSLSVTFLALIGMALTIEDLKHVKEFLYSIRWKWQDLGIELEVDDDNELQAILHKYRDDHGCSLRDLLRLWLNSGKATVGLLKGALKSKAINEPKLAKEGMTGIL